MSDQDNAGEATPYDRLIRQLLDPNEPKTELEHFAARLVREVWHFASCPYDHCERCISEEKLIKLLRDHFNEWDLFDAMELTVS